jgi:DNA-binding MarR family transcriptional regulator
MSKSYEELANLDRVVHEPARLAILTALSACDSADFTFLRRVIGLTGGNLNAHLTTLETAGFVVLKKRIERKVSHTTVSLTAAGRRAIGRHWEQLDALRREARAYESGTLLRAEPAESN